VTNPSSTTTLAKRIEIWEKESVDYRSTWREWMVLGAVCSQEDVLTARTPQRPGCVQSSSGLWQAASYYPIYCPTLVLNCSQHFFVLWSLNNLLYLSTTAGIFWELGQRSNLAHVETMTIGQYTEGATKSENIFGHSWFRRFLICWHNIYFHCLEFAAELLVILLERKPYGPSNLWNFFLAYCYEASLWFF